MSRWHADKWGPLGSAVATLCCLGAAPLLTALSALGLGFLIDDRILIPLLFLFWLATLWGLGEDRSRHHQKGPLVGSAMAGVLIFAGLFSSPLVAGLGLFLLVAASIWNFFLIRQLGRREEKA